MSKAADRLRTTRHRVLHFATETEVKQVKIAALACVVAGIIGAVIVPGTWSRPLVAGPLLGIGVALVAALVHTVQFREQRLRSGHCAHPLCHGIVQPSVHVPEGFVICPTCKRRWPAAEGMSFLVTQRGAGAGTGRFAGPL